GANAACAENPTDGDGSPRGVVRLPGVSVLSQQDGQAHAVDPRQESAKAEGNTPAADAPQSWAKHGSSHRQDQSDPGRLVWILQTCVRVRAGADRSVGARTAALDLAQARSPPRSRARARPPPMAKSLLCRAWAVLPGARSSL